MDGPRGHTWIPSGDDELANNKQLARGGWPGQREEFKPMTMAVVERIMRNNTRTGPDLIWGIPGQRLEH